MKVTVDRARCSGIGLCEISAPGIFEIGDDSQTHLVRELTDADTTAVEEAVSGCPTSALSLDR